MSFMIVEVWAEYLPAAQTTAHACLAPRIARGNYR